jgi:hypothetical protein
VNEKPYVQHTQNQLSNIRNDVFTIKSGLDFKAGTHQISGAHDDI